MKVNDVAAKLEVSPGLVYKLIEHGKLKCFRHGVGRGAIRITDEHLAEYLESISEPAGGERLKWIKSSP